MDAVRRLRRGLTNALRSSGKRWWRQDQLRGELSPRSLHRLCMDRPRLHVFRTRCAVQGQSTAVSVRLDASGSMSSRKMAVARQAMRVLLESLAELKVATEAMTFTTGNRVDVSDVMRETGTDARSRRR
jgi:cobalamin biosynthesis protein CobT